MGNPSDPVVTIVPPEEEEEENCASEANVGRGEGLLVEDGTMPDGVVVGNYRSNLQGKDMNRHFFADDDHDGYRNRALEVETLRS